MPLQFYFTFELLVTFLYPDYFNWLIVLYTLFYNEVNDITNFIAFWNLDLQVYSVSCCHVNESNRWRRKALICKLVTQLRKHSKSGDFSTCRLRPFSSPMVSAAESVLK